MNPLINSELAVKTNTQNPYHNPEGPRFGVLSMAFGDLSFGDVPFLVLRSVIEKNAEGSTVPLRLDLAAGVDAGAVGWRIGV